MAAAACKFVVHHANGARSVAAAHMSVQSAHERWLQRARFIVMSEARPCDSQLAASIAGVYRRQLTTELPIDTVPDRPIRSILRDG